MKIVYSRDNISVNFDKQPNQLVSEIEIQNFMLDFCSSDFFD